MVELANDLAVSAADHSRINDDGCLPDEGAAFRGQCADLYAIFFGSTAMLASTDIPLFSLLKLPQQSIDDQKTFILARA